MRRTLLLGLLGVSVACGAIQACGGGDETTPVDTDAGENGSVDHDASTAGTDATTGGDSSTGNDAATQGDTANTDTGTEDAADSGDAAVPCNGVDTACTTGGGQAGLCKNGFCAACVDPTDDNACSTAYSTLGGGDAGDASALTYVCAAGQCVPGNCHDATACAAGKVCVNNNCGGCSNDTQCTGDSRYGASTICSGDGGTCISNACTTLNATCPTSAGHFCCPVQNTVADGGLDAGPTPTCVQGNCCSDTQCSGTTPVCANNVCTACDAHTGDTWVVDPVNGSDNETGSGTVGGVAHNRCAFKTISKAIAAINTAAAQPDGGPGTPPVGTKILVMGPSTAATGETFPLVLPENVTLEGSGAGVVITSTVGTTITAAHAGTAITNVHINGNGTTTTCVDATGGAITLNGVEVKGCTTGVRASNAAMVTATAGTEVHNNATGFRAQNTSSVVLTSTTTPIKVSNNATAGVFVTDQASLTVTGDANNETVLFTGNGVGLWFNQDPTGGTLPTSTVSGLVSKNNTTSGIQLQGGSSIKLRNSASFGNVYGVNIIQSTVTNLENDTSNMDLGSEANADAGANVGNNVFQTQQASAGGIPNTGVGLCVAIQPNKSQTIRAKGNKWATSNKTGTVDCSVTAAALGSTATCAGGGNVGGSAASNGNQTLVDLCTL